MTGAHFVLSGQAAGAVTIGHASERTRQQVHPANRQGHVRWAQDDAFVVIVGIVIISIVSSLFGIELVGQTTHGNDGIERGEWQLRQGTLPKGYLPIMPRSQLKQGPNDGKSPRPICLELMVDGFQGSSGSPGFDHT